MSLITLWRGEVELSPLPRRRVKISENGVEQSPFIGATIRAEVKASDVQGAVFELEEPNGRGASPLATLDVC